MWHYIGNNLLFMFKITIAFALCALPKASRIMTVLLMTSDCQGNFLFKVMVPLFETVMSSEKKST